MSKNVYCALNYHVWEVLDTLTGIGKGFNTMLMDDSAIELLNYANISLTSNNAVELDVLMQKTFNYNGSNSYFYPLGEVFENKSLFQIDKESSKHPDKVIEKYHTNLITYLITNNNFDAKEAEGRANYIFNYLDLNTWGKGANYVGLHLDSKGSKDTFDNPRYNMSKDGSYVSSDSEDWFGSKRYSDTIESTYDYLGRFIKEIYEK